MTDHNRTIHTLRTVTPHVPATPYATGAYVWKCRSCSATLPDDGKSGLHLCPVDHEVMDYTPVKKDYHGGMKG